MIKTITLLLILQKSFESPTSNQYCLSLDDQLNCKICAMSYLSLSKKCLPPPTPIQNCIQYSSPKKCTRCIFSFSPNQDGSICEKITKKDCYIINRQKECSACKREIRIEDGECKKENKIAIRNCAVFSGNQDFSICNVCDKGFTIFTDDISFSKCVEESGENLNCWYMENRSGRFCEACEFGFFMGKDRVCKKSEVYEVNIFGGVKIFVGFVMLLGI